MKIVYISAGAGENRSLTEVALSCQTRGHPVVIVQETSEILDSEEKRFLEILKDVQTCTLLIMKNHGSATYFKKFDQLIAVVKRYSIPTFIHSSLPDEMRDFRDLFPFSDDDYNFVHACLGLGGKENTNTLVLWAIKNFEGIHLEIPALHYTPTEGFFHPSLPDTLEYAAHIKRLDPAKPTIGILTHRSSDNQNIVHPVGTLIRALEAKDMNTLPFFVHTSPSEITGAMGIRKFIDHYLIKDGQPVIDVLIINMAFSQITQSDPNNEMQIKPIYNFFNDLNVPLLQAISVHRPHEEWLNDLVGLNAMDIMSGIIWPEYDGQIITIPLSTLGEYNGRKNVPLPIPGRPERLAEMAFRWASLKKTPVQERKVAILVWQHGLDGLADAAGLDTPQSIIGILQHLQNEGYQVDHIPETGKDLMEEMIAGLTNDTTWISKEQMRDRSVGLVSTQLYNHWFSRIPEKNQHKICADYGPTPGEQFEIDGELCIPGLVNGNIFMGIQPPRGGNLANMEQLIHSTNTVMPHHYLAYYLWVKNVFGAQVIIHMGTHGTLEWLPGKGNAMSEECYPDLVFEDMPNIYPYIINDPGEAVQAKRRSWGALVDYLIPAMMRAEGYGELCELDSILQEYFRAKRHAEVQKASDLNEEIYRIVIAKNLTHDLNIQANADKELVEENAERLYDYICEVRDAIIKDGLHIFGIPPIKERFQEMIYALTRLKNGKIPSLRDSMADSFSVSLRDLLDNPSEYNVHHEMMNGAILDMIDARCSDVIRLLATCAYDRETAIALVQTEYGNQHHQLELCITWICDEIVEHLNQTTDEITNIIRGLNVGFIPPGPSGDPTRGNAHLLPTGRNCYSIDPATIPTQAAWRTGKDLADQMIERYVKEKGEYPQNVGIVIWATDTMRTGGDDIAYLYWLMGLRPVWSARGGAVTGLEVIPLHELGRPRLDVTLRISGMFRDSFPNLVHLIDEGVEMIASLDESDDVNFLAAHLKQDMVKKIKEGLSEQEARALSLVRIFGDPPGNHGCALGKAVNSSVWKDRTDLADVYTAWGAHAYGRKFQGENVSELFKERFSQLNATVKNLTSREFDILDVDDHYIILGGMNVCVKAYGDEDPVSFIGEASDPKHVKTRLVDEEMRFIYRSRVLNPRFIEGLKPHGFRGVQEITKIIEYTFGWDVTSDAADDWQYQAFTEHFLFDKENREWIEENNPYALHNMAGRLLEAHERGFWETDEETIRKIQEIYLESEDYLERSGDDPQ